MKKILGTILAAGFLFRLLFLGKRQLWTDELMQAMILRSSSISEMIARLREGMAFPAPLDYFVQKGIVLVLGESTWTLRLHAVIFGTLSLWIFFRIACLLFGERVAVYSTILFTLYPLHYHYSQEGRAYALFVFLTLVSYDILLRKVIEKDGGWAGWIVLGALLALLLYTSFLGSLVLLSQMIGLVLTARWPSKSHGPNTVPAALEGEPSDIRPASWSHAVAYGLVAAAACALFVPWIRFAWQPAHVAEASEIANPKLVLRIIKELGDNSYVMSGLLLLAAGTGFRALLRHGCRRSLLWLFTWLVVSIPVLIVVEIWSGYFFAIRHILHTTPALVLLAGYGLSYVGERLTILDRLPYRVSAPAIGYAGLLMLISIWIAQSHWRREPVDWRGTANFLEENVRSGDALTMPQIYLLLEYYSPSLENFRVDDIDPGPGLLATGEANRRFVVCLNQMKPDPCSVFRVAAAKEAAWRKQAFRGLTIYIREKQPVRRSSGAFRWNSDSQKSLRV